jgi:RNA polymerase sigma-70 factor (ECF subfamily)
MDDSAAVQRCLTGDPEALRTLVERYQGRALGHAIAIIGNRDDARDAVQEAFLNAHKALHTFERERAFYPWFYAILRNCCYRQLASRRTDAFDSGVRVDLLESPGVSVEERLAIEQALAALSPADREIVMLRHFDGLSYAELAAALGIPGGTVMSRLFNARKRLRESLARGIAPEQVRE